MKDEAFGIVPIFSNESEPLFLLIQHQAGHWAFPKGHANPGESPAETARREFEEETGISDFQMLEEPSFTENYSFVKQEKAIEPTGHYAVAGAGEVIEKTVIYFLGFVNSMEVVMQEEEVQNFAWVSYEDAIKLITFEENRKMFQRVKEYLEQQNDR
ncbi:MAG: NUDIX domain-containing protein [Oscillatoriaceae cyanobacterium Prado104]|jgi:8-oxo-dGTP pyrophosphatase MutT (NUDIX family)|nr:NUDIX domain-containing protein [Oscillatoriaceae cyanobacterium Prado104]